LRRDAGDVAGQQQGAFQRGGWQGALVQHRFQEAARLAAGGADLLPLQPQRGDMAFRHGQDQRWPSIRLRGEPRGDRDIGEARRAIGAEQGEPRILDLGERHLPSRDRIDHGAEARRGQGGAAFHPGLAQRDAARLARAAEAGGFGWQQARAEVGGLGGGYALDHTGQGGRQAGGRLCQGGRGHG